MTARTRRTMNGIITTGLVYVATLVFLFPVFWMILSSFKVDREVQAVPMVWIPTKLTLNNYIKIFGAHTQAGSAAFGSYVLHSTTVALFTTFLSLVLGTAAAYAFARYRFKGKNGYFFFLLLMRGVPGIALSLPLLIMTNRIKLSNSVAGLIIVYTALIAPFVTWLMEGFFTEIPPDLAEQALVDGASKWQAMILVDLPLSAPGLAASGLFAFLLSWNEFPIASIIAPGSASRTLPVGLLDYVSEFFTDWGGITAAGTLTLLPAVVFTLLVQRHIIRGLTFGAVKE